MTVHPPLHDAPAASQDRSSDPPRAVVLDVGAEPVGLLDWGGGPETVLFLHPNGFCAGLFDPVARALPGRFRPVAVDLRGHGRSHRPAADDAELSFRRMATTVAEALDQYGVRQAHLVGCSLGGGVAIILNALRPDLALSMLLCEAGAFPAGAREETNPMEGQVRRRRRRWPDREAMRVSYAGRGAMADLGKAALDAYLTWGVRDTGTGDVELICDPEVEATVARVSHTAGGAVDAWIDSTKIRVPVTVAVATNSFLPRQLFELQAAHLGARLVEQSGGHLFFFRDARRSAELVASAAVRSE